MILCIKSFRELMLTSEARIKSKSNFDKKELNKSIKNSYISKSFVKIMHDKLIKLPNIPRSKRRKWVKSKEAVSRFLDELDYNNQIQSSYDLTLLERQKSYDQNNAA